MKGAGLAMHSQVGQVLAQAEQLQPPGQLPVHTLAAQFCSQHRHHEGAAAVAYQQHLSSRITGLQLADSLSQLRHPAPQITVTRLTQPVGEAN